MCCDVSIQWEQSSYFVQLAGLSEQEFFSQHLSDEQDTDH